MHGYLLREKRRPLGARFVKLHQQLRIFCFIVYLLQTLVIGNLSIRIISKVASRSIIDFIKETGFCCKI